MATFQSLTKSTRARAVAALGAALVILLLLTQCGGSKPTAEHPGGAAHSPEAGHDGHDGHDHNDNDPATKNLISRDAEAGAEAHDPTTPAQARANKAAAVAQRNQPVATLAAHPIDAPQPEIPTDRYNLFNGCYALQSTQTQRWVSTGTSPAVNAATPQGSGIYFKPTDLGSYMMYTGQQRLFSAANGKVTTITDPGPAANWIVTMPSAGQFRFFHEGAGYLAATPTGQAVFTKQPAANTQFTPHKTAGCAVYPEVDVNVSGPQMGGTNAFQETRGYIDAHTHGMAFEFLGGDAHCGRPWSPWGVTVALKDCLDHYATGGYGAVLEDFLSGKQHHDPIGWPSFKDWPAAGSLTHEGTYYKWMERSWRGGQRTLVNLLVENNQLCTIYPIKHNSCDDIASIDRQAVDMRQMERYIDAQHGGPGQGWYRIVTDPDQARAVINSGKMAVIMGIETSVLFDCHERLGQSSCTTKDVDQRLQHVYDLGVRQMELVNKFDNAFAGVAGDTGTTGYLVNSANILETGSPWRMETCSPNDYPADNGIHDKDQDNSAALPKQDALFGGILATLQQRIGGLTGLNLPALPVYPSKHHCNTMGLTSLGEYLVQKMAQKHMIIDPDHMSVKARKATLDVIDRLGYSGVVSSHSWATPDAYPRIYGEKGFITPYAGDSTGFVTKWKQMLNWANPKTYWGIGFGADINGFGAQGDPRPNALKNHPVTYPFTGFGGTTIDREHGGTRVWDINTDGVAHYGLYPDWIQDLRMLAGDAIVQDMERGPEAYLQMWERADGIAPNGCTYPDQARNATDFTSLRPGMSPWQVLNAVGQPSRRLGNQFNYCTRQGKATVTFTPGGALTSVTSD